MDDLYNGWENPFDHHLTEALMTTCSAHKKSLPFSLSRYDWSREEFKAAEEVPSSDLLILEGVGSSQTAIREFLTVSIWIDIEPTVGAERVLRRDGEVIATHMPSWLTIQEKHFLVNDSMNNADFVLSN